MTKNFRKFFNIQKWPKIFEIFLTLKSDQKVIFFFRKIFSTKKWPKIFSKFFEKIDNFPDLPLDFFKKYFFWSYQLLWNFFWRKLRCIWPVFKESGMCYYTASYLKSQFCRPGGVFWPFLDPREAKKGKKKGKQTNSWQKKLPSKKTYECWLLCRKKIMAVR